MGHSASVTDHGDQTRTRGRRRVRRGAAAFLLTVAAVSGCAGSTRNGQRATGNSGPLVTLSPAARSNGPGASNPCGTVAVPTATYQHVIWIWMENHTASEVLGNADAPYTTALARRCGRAALYASVGSPSLPNYLGATSGATHGIGDDDPPASHPLAVANLFQQVRAAGQTERSYEESMRAPCQLESDGEYAVKHNPAPYYVGPGDRAACAHDDVPLGSTAAGALRQDLEQGTLPTFSFITPNLCSDTHDCPVGDGDRWLGQWMPMILDSGAYREGRTAVFVVWDEPTPMPLVVISPRTTPGTVASPSFSHYALLRTTEELLGLSPLLGHAAGAPSMRPAFGL
jgi:Phosphoesterase family